MTSLVGGTRVKKDHQRIEAYGSVDEVIAFTASLRDQILESMHSGFLLWIEDRLMVISSILACSDKSILEQLPSISEEDILKIESEIDRMDLDLRPLTHFVLPGGALAISACHIARTVCRRSEREVIRLADLEEIDYLLVRYLNRLSDYFFTLSRTLHRELNVDEIIWKP